MAKKNEKTEQKGKTNSTDSKAWYVGGAIVALLAIAIAAAIALSGGSTPVSAASATLYKSESCGCCGVYSTYMDKKGYDVTIEQMTDVTPKKEELGIPAELQSCHTTMIGDYFVEGHVPVEAIEKLLTEKPDIKGIALPGMPSGSPGMPGSKQGQWVIYAVQQDGSVTEFMRV